jgi:hypothetical protein
VDAEPGVRGADLEVPSLSLDSFAHPDQSESPGSGSALPIVHHANVDSVVVPTQRHTNIVHLAGVLSDVGECFLDHTVDDRGGTRTELAR